MREQWQKVLDAELRLWSAKPWDQLLAELPEVQVYEVDFESRQYQVEVEILHKTATELQVMVAVDDGTLPASFSPLVGTFVVRKSRTVE